MGMLFNAADLRQELIELEAIAAKFLERGSENKLSTAAAPLKLIAHDRNTSQPWQIDPAAPLWTVPNKGCHEKDGKGKNLVGCLSFIWILRGDGKKQVEVVDKASTVLSIHENDANAADRSREDRCIQKWNIDLVTTASAPGPAFHAQVQNTANVPVPRLPSLLVSPADCLDYLLGELFQDRWREHQIGHARIRSFSKYQQSRFRALLSEHLSWLKDIGDSSAWTTLKDQRPRDELFRSS